METSRREATELDLCAPVRLCACAPVCLCACAPEDRLDIPEVRDTFGALHALRFRRFRRPRRQCSRSPGRVPDAFGVFEARCPQAGCPMSGTFSTPPMLCALNALDGRGDIGVLQIPVLLYFDTLDALDISASRRFQDS